MKKTRKGTLNEIENLIPLQKQSVPSNNLSLFETNRNAEQINVIVFNF